MDLSGFYWTDTNADGWGDFGTADTNADGYIDTMATDANFDGYVEGYAYDTNVDGLVDQATTDTDLDGFLDSTGWDVNADGTFDYYADASTGGQTVATGGGTVDLNTAITGATVVGPSSGTSPQSTLAGLLGMGNPLTDVMLTTTIDSMNDTAGIWTAPDVYYW